MILASASPRRLELLRECGLDVRVLSTDIDETRREGETARELVRRLATEKAHAALALIESEGPLREPLVAADTIVWDDQDDIYGKPQDAADAHRMLATLSSGRHWVSTGVCVLVPSRGILREKSFIETTGVIFRTLTEREIDAYIRSGEPMDKAGAYGIQGLGRLLVAGIEGDYQNVVGLPVCRTIRTIDELEGTDRLTTTILGGSHA